MNPGKTREVHARIDDFDQGHDGCLPISVLHAAASAYPYRTTAARAWSPSTWSHSLTLCISSFWRNSRQHRCLAQFLFPRMECRTWEFTQMHVAAGPGALKAPHSGHLRYQLHGIQPWHSSRSSLLRYAVEHCRYAVSRHDVPVVQSRAFRKSSCSKLVY